MSPTHHRSEPCHDPGLANLLQSVLVHLFIHSTLQKPLPRSGSSTGRPPHVRWAHTPSHRPGIRKEVRRQPLVVVVTAGLLVFSHSFSSGLFANVLVGETFQRRTFLDVADIARWYSLPRVGHILAGAETKVRGQGRCIRCQAMANVPLGCFASCARRGNRTDEFDQGLADAQQTRRVFYQWPTKFGLFNLAAERPVDPSKGAEVGFRIVCPTALMCSGNALLPFRCLPTRRS